MTTEPHLEHGGKPTMKQPDWKLVPAQDGWAWYVAEVEKYFIPRLESVYQKPDRWRIAILTAYHYGRCIFRTNRDFTLDEAKTEAPKIGLRVALSEAKKYAAIAEGLRDYRA